MTLKPKYIFTLTTGHAGGTLLNLLLGASPLVFAAGESLRISNLKLLTDFSNSTQLFWNQIATDVAKNGWRINEETMSKADSLPSDFWKSWTQAISQRVDGRVVADKSLSFTLIRRLCEEDLVDPYFIHLIRDPRAVEYSYFKKYGFNPKHALGWQKSHLSFEEFLKDKTNFIRVRYEDLCRCPNQQVRKILKGAGSHFDVDFEDGYPNDISQIGLSDPIFENLIFSGNRMRLAANRTGRSIESDVSFIDQLPKRFWIYTTLACLIGIRAYGYPLAKSSFIEQ